MKKLHALLRIRKLTFPMFTLCALFLLGCGQEQQVKRGRIHGSVNLDGQPLAKGQIRFFSLGTGGVGTDGEIVNGKYEIPLETGPSAGPYRVEILSLKSTGKRVMDPDTREMIDEMINELPRRYHVDSTLQINYDPSSDKPFDFELKRK